MVHVWAGQVLVVGPKVGDVEALAFREQKIASRHERRDLNS